jgi:hypothetical protein
MHYVDRAKVVTYRPWFGIVASAIAAGMLIPPVLGPSARAAEPKPMVMFVQIADELSVDDKAHTLRLVKVGQQTVYFADRPQRIAGHIKMADYLTEWTSKAGADNFHNSPPNATVSVFEPGHATDTLAVVTVSNPKVEGVNLVYNYMIISGTLPESGRAAVQRRFSSTGSGSVAETELA